MPARRDRFLRVTPLASPDTSRWARTEHPPCDVVDPSPRLAVASFRARLSRNTCECGFPNVVDFPRNGAFEFVWEYMHPSGRGLADVPTRPGRFRISPGRDARLTCDGSTDTFSFKDAGRVFQVEVYLGPAITPALRGQLAELLDSWIVAPRP